MSELGQRLKQARLEKKMSLDDLQEITKIRTRYLEAIEEGNYKVLPGSFYVRAFIKSYAEAVGLDPNEVLNMYQGTIPAAPPEPAVETIRTPRRSSSARNTDRLSRWASTVMVISFVVLIGAIVYYFVVVNNKGPNEGSISDPVRVTDKADPNATAAPNAGTPTASASPTPTVTPTPTPTPTPATSLTLVSSEKSLDTYTATGGKLDIVVTASGAQCWYRVDSIVNGAKKMEKQDTLKQGANATFSLTSSAQIRVGSAMAAKITVNGQELTVGDTSNPKNIKINLQ
ncbi:helix-turn-helix domain-containing protein [Paenibacillus lutrae]|uniref:DUF4115 domain-containing protein n=1 Tax=Paenibacillus lutrae TaxID=2078573 RepID=A0A7X3FG45_9BACL|nr:RodZ domain-containing protein [Paenibacillus lutrae]MVO99089.1 DUF4115 domain-containing protein [Paenibacillus lutrae]